MPHCGKNSTKEMCEKAKEIDRKLDKAGIGPADAILNGNIHNPLDVVGPKKGRVRAGSPCSSFAPGTKVLMADGTKKSIEDIKAGDEVVATDPKTGKNEAKSVTAPITSEGVKNLVRVTVDSDGDQGGETGIVTATDTHPFWVPTARQWEQAGTLRPGQWLQTSQGTYLKIAEIEKSTSADQRVHNLTVADLHTYYVQAGTTSVLVHNSGPCGLKTPAEAGILPSEARRIQNAANRMGARIVVVGSRASGTAKADSDWDYILSGSTGRLRSRAASSLPEGIGGDWQGRRRGQDIFQDYNPDAPGYSTLDPERPHVIFDPEP